MTKHNPAFRPSRKHKRPPLSWNPFRTKTLLPKGPISLRRQHRRSSAPPRQTHPDDDPLFPMDPRFPEDPQKLKASLHPSVYKALVLIPRRSQANNPEGFAHFSHQIHLDTTTGTPFFKRGMALAAAGRSPNILYKDHSLRTPHVYQLQTISTLRRDWLEASTTFADAGPPTKNTLMTLWHGVKFIMANRVHRSMTWGCPTIHTACTQQFCDLTLLENLSLEILNVPPDLHGQHPFLSAHFRVATLFTPFWSEHILGFGRLTTQQASDWALGMILQPSPIFARPMTPPERRDTRPAYTTVVRKPHLQAHPRIINSVSQRSSYPHTPARRPHHSR